MTGRGDVSDMGGTLHGDMRKGRCGKQGGLLHGTGTACNEGVALHGTVRLVGVDANANMVVKVSSGYLGCTHRPCRTRTHRPAPPPSLAA